MAQRVQKQTKPLVCFPPVADFPCCGRNVPIGLAAGPTARAERLACMPKNLPSGKKVLTYTLGTLLVAFPAMILVYRLVS